MVLIRKYFAHCTLLFIANLQHGAFMWQLDIPHLPTVLKAERNQFLEQTQQRCDVQIMA
jgi:hypothetical protein